MSRPTVGRLMALERLLKNDAIMLPRYRQAGGMGIILSKAMNEPHDFVRTDTAYILDLGFLPGISAHAKFLEVGGATVVDSGSLVSAGVTSIVSKDADAVTLDTYAIPAEVQALTGYGWSAGNVCNYIDLERKVFVQCVGAIDLGDIPWHTAGTEESRYFSTFSSEGASVWAAAGGNPAIPGSWTTTANALTVEYPTKTRNEVNAHTKGIAISGSNNIGRPYVCDPDKDTMTGSQFRTSMAGVILYYELATPIETDISAYLTDDNTMPVESGGTLTFENQLGDNYRIPVPSKIEYIRRT